LFIQKPRVGTLKDVSLAEAGKWGTLNEYAFFDKVIQQGPLIPLALYL